MATRRARAALLVGVLVAGLVAGCGGATTIRTGRQDALIYVDGQLAGTGTAEIKRTGWPQAVTIDVLAPDGARGQAQARRSITVKTILIGVITFGVGALFSLEYPEDLHVVLPPPLAGPAPGSGWDVAPAGGGVDPWMTPPAGWQPAAPVAPVAPPAPDR